MFSTKEQGQLVPQGQTIQHLESLGGPQLTLQQ